MGKGKESDPTDASVNTSANASVDTPLTHYRHVGRHTTDISVQFGKGMLSIRKVP